PGGRRAPDFFRELLTQDTRTVRDSVPALPAVGGPAFRRDEPDGAGGCCVRRRLAPTRPTGRRNLQNWLLTPVRVSAFNSGVPFGFPLAIQFREESRHEAACVVCLGDRVPARCASGRAGSGLRRGRIAIRAR